MIHVNARAHRRRPRGSEPRGHTLIEAIVTLAIMGVLATLGIPRFHASLEQSRANVAGASLRSIWSAQRCVLAGQSHVRPGPVHAPICKPDRSVPGDDHRALYLPDDDRQRRQQLHDDGDAERDDELEWQLLHRLQRRPDRPGPVGRRDHRGDEPPMRLIDAAQGDRSRSEGGPRDLTAAPAAADPANRWWKSRSPSPSWRSAWRGSASSP